MQRIPASLYLGSQQETLAILQKSFTQALSQVSAYQPLPIFFRADDIGTPSAAFSRMMGKFSRHRMPLCLAVVPAWLTRTRWAHFASQWDTSSELWYWHQHGWRHANHEAGGKKCEFGKSRTVKAIKDDLVRGRERLERIIGTDFRPFFTPPWNRCSPATLALLSELGFKGVSRSNGEQKAAESSGAHPLLDCFINVDLHTRKEPGSADCLAGLAGEFSRAAAAGHIGVMLHHQRMNEAAFRLLDGLLDFVARTPTLQPVHFNGFPGGANA